MKLIFVNPNVVRVILHVLTNLGVNRFQKQTKLDQETSHLAKRNNLEDLLKKRHNSSHWGGIVCHTAHWCSKQSVCVFTKLFLTISYLFRRL